MLGESHHIGEGAGGLQGGDVFHLQLPVYSLRENEKKEKTYKIVSHK